MNHSNLRQQAEEFLRQTNSLPADLLAYSATKTVDQIETEFGIIEVKVNPYIPSGSIYIVNKKAFEEQFHWDWKKQHATTNGL